jgi:hypothetical protein
MHWDVITSSSQGSKSNQLNVETCMHHDIIALYHDMNTDWLNLQTAWQNVKLCFYCSYIPHPASIKYATEVYKNKPGRIEDYEPGHSSISDKETKQVRSSSITLVFKHCYLHNSTFWAPICTEHIQKTFEVKHS